MTLLLGVLDLPMTGQTQWLETGADWPLSSWWVMWPAM